MEIKDELLDIEGIKNSNKPILDLFIRRAAVLCSTPEYLTEKIIKDQWKNANKQSQAEIETGEIDFPNLGTFFISKTKANRRLKRSEKALNLLVVKGPDTNKRVEAKRAVKMQYLEETMKSIKFKTKQLHED